MTAAKNMCTKRERDFAPTASTERPIVTLLLTTPHITSTTATPREVNCDNTKPNLYHRFRHSKQHNMCLALTYPVSISQQSCAWTYPDIHFMLTFDHSPQYPKTEIVIKQ